VRLAHIEALAGRLRAVVALAADDAPPASDARRGRAQPDTDTQVREAAWTDAIAVLRANLTFRSAAFRHAVRLAVCLAGADVIARGLHLPWPYWVPLTVAVVLRPEFGSTFSRGVGRVVGTLLGLALGSTFVQLPIGGSLPSVALIGLLVFGDPWPNERVAVLTIEADGMANTLVTMVQVLRDGSPRAQRMPRLRSEAT
jgi:uncharacterized membrane protein YccC